MLLLRHLKIQFEDGRDGQKRAMSMEFLELCIFFLSQQLKDNSFFVVNFLVRNPDQKIAVRYLQRKNIKYINQKVELFLNLTNQKVEHE
uniref:Uncharacterized protein n=1 Tax=Noccaea caerulescens TaxID=107243 RepID=A0A1J3EPP2_NOCCA